MEISTTVRSLREIARSCASSAPATARCPRWRPRPRRPVPSGCSSRHRARAGPPAEVELLARRRGAADARGRAARSRPGRGAPGRACCWCTAGVGAAPSSARSSRRSSRAGFSRGHVRCARPWRHPTRAWSRSPRWSPPPHGRGLARAARRTGRSLGRGADVATAALHEGLKTGAAVFVGPAAELARAAAQFTAALGFSRPVGASACGERIAARVGRPWSAFDVIALAADAHALPLAGDPRSRRSSRCPGSRGRAIAQAWRGAEMLMTDGLGHRADPARSRRRWRRRSRSWPRARRSARMASRWRARALEAADPLDGAAGGVSSSGELRP